MNYAVINDDGLVVNVIIWDGQTPVEEPGTLVPLPTTTYQDIDGNDYEAEYGGIGWTYDGSNWTPPA